MKFKNLFFAALVIGAFATASCNKEKDCKCVTTAAGSVVAETTEHIEKGDCSDLNKETTVAGITSKIECTEK